MIIISEETSNISPFCVFEWFDRVMFSDKMSPYLDDCVKLGRYLGQKIDVGPAMMAKNFSKNTVVLSKMIRGAKRNVEHSWSQFTRGLILGL